VHTPRRWYLLAYDLDRRDWRTFRVDRIEELLGPPGARFTPRPLPREGTAAYVSHSISTAPYAHRARILFHAPMEQVAPRTSPAAARLKALVVYRCRLHVGYDSPQQLADHVAPKGLAFELLEPPELNPVLPDLSDRLRKAAQVAY